MTNFKEQSNQIMNKNSEIIDTVRTLNGELKELKERHKDLQRSMRDNLIFDGIQEQTEEDTEEVLKTFIQKEMNVSDELPFHRVHRMGKGFQGSIDLKVPCLSSSRIKKKYDERHHRL